MRVLNLRIEKLRNEVKRWFFLVHVHIHILILMFHVVSVIIITILFIWVFCSRFVPFSLYILHAKPEEPEASQEHQNSQVQSC